MNLCVFQFDKIVKIEETTNRLVNLRKPISIMFKIKFTSSYLVIMRKDLVITRKDLVITRKLSRNYEKIKS